MISAYCEYVTKRAATLDERGRIKVIIIIVIITVILKRRKVIAHSHATNIPVKFPVLHKERNCL